LQQCSLGGVSGGSLDQFNLSKKERGLLLLHRIARVKNCLTLYNLALAVLDPMLASDNLAFLSFFSRSAKVQA
jgi:hypothetical protein